MIQSLIQAVWKLKGKFECQPIVSIGCYAKDAPFTKDASLNKVESRARSTTVPIPAKVPPRGQWAAKGEHVARIDVGTIEVIDRMISNWDLRRDKRDLVSMSPAFNYYATDKRIIM